jgi:PKHD-type hydroxylase
MLSLRKVSITVQLSDPSEYEGGDLDIWQGGKEYITAPRGKGTVVIFPSYMMHRVSPVTVGTRRSFVLWLGGEHYR